MKSKNRKFMSPGTPTLISDGNLTEILNTLNMCNSELMNTFQEICCKRHCSHDNRTGQDSSTTAIYQFLGKVRLLSVNGKRRISPAKTVRQVKRVTCCPDKPRFSNPRNPCPIASFRSPDFLGHIPSFVTNIDP